MKKLYIETYGCQMNVADSETVAAIMQMAGHLFQPGGRRVRADGVDGGGGSHHGEHVFCPRQC